jgi:hypothetical protein
MSRNLAQLIVKDREFSYVYGTTNQKDLFTQLHLANIAVANYLELKTLSFPGIDVIMPLKCYNSSMFSFQVVGDRNNWRLK